MSLDKLRIKLETKINLSPHFGEITHIYSNRIKANGLKTSIGDIVSIKGTDNHILGIVSAIDVESFSIIPFTSTPGYRIGDKVFVDQKGLKIGVGDGLLGRVVDTMANPIDNLGEIKKDTFIPILNKPIKAMNRGLIDEKFSVGIKSIDGLLKWGYLQVAELENQHFLV